jgi:hypothetical protein
VLRFAAMVAVCGAVFALLLYALAPFEILGVKRVSIAIGATALYGVLGHFVFDGDGSVRTFLTFLSVVAFGALLAVAYEPAKVFFPLISSVPFAAVAALATRVTGLCL